MEQNNVISIFEQANVFMNEGRMQPTLGAFLSELGVSQQQSPITFTALKDIFEKGYDKQIGIDSISQNYSKNVELYKRRMESIRNRARLMDRNDNCPDGAMGIALNYMRCQKSFSNVDQRLSNDVNEVANQFWGFVLDSQPNQDKFDSLKDTSKLLVFDYILNCYNDLTVAVDDLDVTNSEQRKRVTDFCAQMNKFQPLDYTSCGTQPSEMLENLFTLFKSKKRSIELKLETYRDKKISKFSLCYYNLR